jgi:hypothetical protein
MVMQALNRIGQSGDFASADRFLASHDARSITGDMSC